VFNLVGNDLRVLDFLWQHRALSRTRLAEMTGLTVPSLSRIAQRLINQKLAREASVAREGKRGQPTILIEINPKAGFTLGITIAPDSFAICLMDFHGDICGEKFVDISGTHDQPETIALQIGNEVQNLIIETKVPRKKIIGAGISIPGEYINDSFLYHTIDGMSAWEDIDLIALFEPVLKVPVLCDNVGKASAFLEARFGAGRHYEYFTYIHLSHGIGGGIIYNRSLLRGAGGNAAAFGNFYPSAFPRPSAKDLQIYLQSNGLCVPNIQTIQRMSIPDEIIESWIERAADQLSTLVNNLYWTLSPQAIIIGGLLPETIMSRLISKICLSDIMHNFSNYRKFPPVIMAEHLGTGPQRGAATLSFQRLMPSG
jgi:predicted NBD/HSP70 family sugar kinase